MRSCWISWSRISLIQSQSREYCSERLTTMMKGFRSKPTLFILNIFAAKLGIAMVYKVIGLMSGSSLDGLDIAYVHLQERGSGAARSAARGEAAGWDFQLIHTECVPYPNEWRERLARATGLSAREYWVLHTEYGRWVGEQVERFIA